jgi:hypothetical protein
MYKIITEKGELVVSPDHKVYSSLMLKKDKRSVVFAVLAVLGAILVLIAIVGLIRLNKKIGGTGTKG